MWNRFILPKLGSQFNINNNNNIYPLARLQRYTHSGSGYLVVVYHIAEPMSYLPLHIYFNS